MDIQRKAMVLYVGKVRIQRQWAEITFNAIGVSQA